MDMDTLGRRVAQAREESEITQEGLAEAIGIERSAVSRLESGSRKLNVPELVRIASFLKRPLAFFIAEPIPVLSRRAESHSVTVQLDSELELFASDVSWLMTRGLLTSPEREVIPLPLTHGAAEQAAGSVRGRLQLNHAPIVSLSSAAESVGLYTVGLPLGAGGPDGVSTDLEAAGVAVVNTDAPYGRRRMTLAHELGHWIFADAYEDAAASEAERMIRAFAIHFLAPRAGVVMTWTQTAGSEHDKALTVAAKFRISWSAALGHLSNLHLIDHHQREMLTRSEPRRGDYLRLGLEWQRDDPEPVLSPAFTAAVLQGFTAGRITEARSLEMLRGTIDRSELPARPERTMSDLFSAFQGHGE